MVKLEIYTDCAKAYDSGKMFALATPEQELQIIQRCKDLADFKDCRFILHRLNVSAKGSGLVSLNDSQILA